MMSYPVFHEATEIKNCVRGTELRRIDKRLEQLDETSAISLVALLAAIAAWIVAKEEKHGDSLSENYLLRWRVISQLRTEVKQALGADGESAWKRAKSFEMHKEKGAKHFGLQSLGAGYAIEREQYKDFKKDKPDKTDRANLKGASAVSSALSTAVGAVNTYKTRVAIDPNVTNAVMALCGNDEKLYNLLVNRELKSLGTKEFNLLWEKVNAGELPSQNQPYVHFLRKSERIEKFLTWCYGGKFYKQDGVPYTTPMNSPDLYAMDKYGNLITMASNVFYNMRTNQYGGAGASQHNHSSLNAGADVISAGMIAFANGKVTYIDNNSGHYKPHRKQLLNAVKSLDAADQADLSQINIRTFWMTGKTLNERDYNWPTFRNQSF